MPIAARWRSGRAAVSVVRVGYRPVTAVVRSVPWSDGSAAG